MFTGAEHVGDSDTDDDGRDVPHIARYRFVGVARYEDLPGAKVIDPRFYQSVSDRLAALDGGHERLDTPSLAERAGDINAEAALSTYRRSRGVEYQALDRTDSTASFHSSSASSWRSPNAIALRQSRFDDKLLE